MITEEKIQFWASEAKRSLAVARDLFKSKRYLEALFFGHLALEKALKSVIVKQTQKDPVYSHDLVILAKYATINLDKNETEFLTRINTYNIRARYQDYKKSLYKKATKNFTQNELKLIDEFFNKIK